MNGKIEYGDYQTPCDFASKICILLKEKYQLKPRIVVEPTCGIGNFVKSSLIFDANEYYGIEINPTYCLECRQTITDRRVSIINEDVFQFDLQSITDKSKSLLILGNPPWVNNSVLSTLGSTNVPHKENIKGLSGMDAITGSSNFDISEYILLQVIKNTAGRETDIAMLCKTSVARNIFCELKRNNIWFSCFDIYLFDSKKIFNISASACLMYVHLTETSSTTNVCNLYKLDEPNEITSFLEYRNGVLHRDLPTECDDFDGNCCFEWRQGIKHDCSKIMELDSVNNQFINGNSDLIEIEQDLVYPLIKSSMIKKPKIDQFSKYVIVTQKKVHEDTAYIEKAFPLTWNYLSKNRNYFEKRKSSIYRESSQFAMFGIGDYSYSQYKVAISGFYKKPLFSILCSDNGKPVMTDDTCYFLCFQTYDMAYVAMLFLNSERVQNYIKSIAFLDSKRPYTKKILKRIDFQKIQRKLSCDDLIETEQKLGLEKYVTPKMYDDFTYIINAQLTF